jgi:aminoglycoside phosphotransferase
VTKAGEPGRYLKVDARPESELRAEKERMEWLVAHLPVPQVLAFEEDEGRQYLLTSALPGRDASDSTHARDMPRLVRLLAEGMRRFHALPVANCPFDHRLELMIDEARRRTRAGRVDETDFDAVRQGRTAEDLLKELERTRPGKEDLVVTHGDYCLPNVMIARGRISGFVDLGRAGVSDRHRDLALAARSLAHNFGAEWVPLLFQEYGQSPDPAKIEFFQLLDEFF